MDQTLFYADLPLDRAAHLRKDADFLAAARMMPSSRFLPIWQDKSLIDGTRAVLWTPDQAAIYPQALSEAILLGVDREDGAAWWALDLSALPETLASTIGTHADFVDLWRAGMDLPAGEAAIAALAKGLAYWNGHHRFCGHCGHATAYREAGHMRKCTHEACGKSHFPRTDPAVIMLVTAEKDGAPVCLLGRHARLPSGMYSTLAGFLEPGETLEQTVAREVMEEAGLPVTDIRYMASQPWPFPASLMVAFTARATDLTITIDQDELEEARWFTAADIAGMEADGLRLPRKHSIARMMVEDWLAKTA